MRETALRRLPVPPVLHPQDEARANLYALCARLLLVPPDEALFDNLRNATPLSAAAPDQPLPAAWKALSRTSKEMTPASVAEEFDALFTATGTPLLNPYGSKYLAGFLMEKPLARLRDDLAALGLGRGTQSGELEDHLGALCETMRLLCAGDDNGLFAAQTLQVQQRFFETHIAPWYADCLHEMAEAPGARFYSPVSGLVAAFLDLEAEAFDMAEEEFDSFPSTSDLT